MSATTIDAMPIPAPSRSLRLPHAIEGAIPSVSPRGADLPADQVPLDAQKSHVGGELSSDQRTLDAQTPRVAAELSFCAATVDDIESVRIAMANRIDAMEREGRPFSHYHQMLDELERIEHQAELALRRAMRKHPLGPWVKCTIGVGEKQAARLLAAIGDVTWNHAENRPRRGPAELWAYCGYRPDQKRRKGVQSNWNADAKMRAFLIAESCIKQSDSPYRIVYDAARVCYAESTHDTSCPRCGPSGKPALPGSPLSLGHQHARALRKVAKTVLKDMFIETKRLAGDHLPHDIHQALVAGEVFA